MLGSKVMRIFKKMIFIFFLISCSENPEKTYACVGSYDSKGLFDSNYTKNEFAARLDINLDKKTVVMEPEISSGKITKIDGSKLTIFEEDRKKTHTFDLKTEIFNMQDTEITGVSIKWNNILCTKK